MTIKNLYVWVWFQKKISMVGWIFSFPICTPPPTLTSLIKWQSLYRTLGKYAKIRFKNLYICVWFQKKIRNPWSQTPELKCLQTNQQFRAGAQLTLRTTTTIFWLLSSTDVENRYVQRGILAQLTLRITN